MKKVINNILYIIIFLLVSSIFVISIKKFFDNKTIFKLDSIAASNTVTKFVSHNEIDEVNVENLNISNDESEQIIENTKLVSEIKEKTTVVKEEISEDAEDVKENETTVNSDILYDNLNEQDLTAKLERSLNNELSGTGINFVNYYKLTGLDPYLAVAIVLHETGCSWNCSTLVKECFNYGGMRGGTIKYRDTNYTCYSSKEEGINAYLNMLYNNYYSKGLTTPELINPKYASSLEWAVKINNYIEKIKNA